MTTQGNFGQRVYCWGLLPGLVLLWLLTFNTGHSLAQTPTPTATPLTLPRQSADLLRARVDTQTAAAAAAAQLQAQSDGTLRVDYNQTTGAARWVATAGTALTHEFAGRNLSPEASARAFLGVYGGLFGVADQAAELQLTQLKGDHLGGQHVTFQQQQGGIKVFGADLKVHLDRTGAVKLINGYTLPTARGVSLTPTLSPDQAAQTAVRTTGFADGVVSSNTLVILNPGLITDQASPTYLTYQVRVDSAAQPDAAVWLFIDAATGEVRFSYPAVTDARNRNTYNSQHGTNLSTAVLARNETGVAVTSAPNCSINDINRAHDYTGQIYDFYLTRFGRDSYDGAGAAMNSYVCYGVGYQNASWTGSSMVYGDGFTLDDVVGHELSHAVTQYISGLIYSGQSGALNESFSDIMGEALDLTNNSGNDASTARWYIGEEISGGALRDMMYPLRFSDPDRTDSSSYDCTTQEVHINSGVQNKAFALMVDGGTFNRYTIAPIGLDKAVAIIYRANDLYLTSSAKFLDAYNAINRSCTELYGAGSADCTNVKLALDATRMSGSVCGVGGVPQPTPPNPPFVSVVNGDFEAGPNVGWSETNNQNLPLITTGYAQTGSWKALLGSTNNNTSAIAQSYSVPASGGTLTYYYKIVSNDTCGYDFAYVEINNTILQTYDLCLGSPTSSLSYGRGSLYLDAYAGQTVTIRFRVTTDSGVESQFYLDNVAVSDTLVPPTATPSPTPTVTPTPTNTPTNTPTATPTSWFDPLAASGNLRLQSNPSFCLTQQGGAISLWRCSGQSGQVWVRYSDNTIRPQANLGACLILPSATAQSGSGLVIGTCLSDKSSPYSKIWLATANGMLKPEVQSSLCLNVNGAVGDGAAINVTFCNSTNPANQQWLVMARPTVAGWGSNSGGESSAPAGLQAVAVAGGRWHTLALQGDGTVVAWGCGTGNYGQCTVPAGLSGVTAIAAAPYHSLALKSDGTVVAWGCGTNYGQCAVPAGLSGVKALAAGLVHSLALKNDGTVVAWGCGAPLNQGQCTIPAGLSGVKALATGIYHTLALKNDGTVVAWGGGNYTGERTVPAGLTNVIAVAAAGSHSLALKSDSTVVAWGENNAGQNNIPAGLSGVTAIAAGAYHSLALKNNGTVVAWGCGAYNNGQCTVPTGLSGVVAIGGGHVHSLVMAAVMPAAGVAASAAVIADPAPITAPTLEGFSFITTSVPVSAPAVGTPVDATQPLSTTEVAAAPAVVETAAQSQRLFLPLVANQGALVDGTAAGAASVQSAVVAAPAVTTTTLTAASTAVVTPTQPPSPLVVAAPITPTLPVTAAPVVTASLPISVQAVVTTPAVVEAPAVTTTQPVTTGDASAGAAAAPDTTAPAAPATTEQNQQLFLPVITTLAGAALGSPGGIAVLALLVIVVVGIIWQRRRSRAGR